MKTFCNFIALGILVFCNIQLFAQDNIAVVSADTLNVLYKWINNPISIAVPGISSDKINVSINNGTITGRNGNYVVKVNSGVEAIINVSVEIKKGEIKNVGRKIFRVKSPPDYKRCISNYCGERVNLTLDELLKNPRIMVPFENSPIEDKLDVESFTGTVIFKEKSKIFSISGNQFSEEFIEYLKPLEPPYKIYIEDIKAIGPNVYRIHVPSMTIRIIDNDNRKQ